MSIGGLEGIGSHVKGILIGEASRPQNEMRAKSGMRMGRDRMLMRTKNRTITNAESVKEAYDNREVVRETFGWQAARITLQEFCILILCC